MRATARISWSGRLLLALLAAVASGPAAAQSARLHVLADSVSVGERFEVAVAVDHAPGRSALFPDVPAGDPEAEPLLALGDVEAFAVRRLPPDVRGAVRTDSAVYTVAAFAVDSARVGPVTVRLAAGADTSAVTARAASVPVRSELNGAPPYEPAPLGPPDAFASPTPALIALGVLGLLLVGGAVWGLARLLRRPTPATPAVAPYPAALARLAELDRETPDAPAEIEAHVVAVREALRTYLARRLDLPAREATTAELEALLRTDRRVPDAAAEAVRQSLRPTDLVAFAALRPAPEAVARIRQAAGKAVEAVEAAVRAHERRQQAEAAGGDGQASSVSSPSAR